MHKNKKAGERISVIGNKKILIATPMYGAQATGQYTAAMINFTKLALSKGLDFDFEFYWNESLITRARNQLAAQFLEYGYDLLVFIDSDIDFIPEDLLDLIYFALKGDDMQIVTASYPLKKHNWESMFWAIKNSKIDSPEQMIHYSGDFVATFWFDESKEIDIYEPQEIFEAGTGFMAIRKEVFEKIKSNNPQGNYVDLGQKRYDFFKVGVDPISERYLSEDFYFCKLARESGIKTWILPWIRLGHVGTSSFLGDFFNYLDFMYGERE
jgi:hypothetical protein